MILTEISFESGGYLLFMRIKSLNQKELWQKKINFDSHLQFTHNIPLDGHNVTLNTKEIICKNCYTVMITL
jgi:hypothetical protein